MSLWPYEDELNSMWYLYIVLYCRCKYYAVEVENSI